jgi:methyl-accepting chemotaxis protein
LNIEESQLDNLISNGNQLKQRQWIIGLLTAAACGAGVYIFHTPFHYWLHDAMGMSDRVADSAGSITIVLISIIINNFISLVIFKDISLGLRAHL